MTNLSKQINHFYVSHNLWGKHYQGAIIFSSERLYLYQIKFVNDSSAESIIQFISDMVNDFSNNKTTVISVSRQIRLKKESNE